MSPVPAGDERERLAALLRVSMPPLLTADLDSWYTDLADRLLAAVVHLTGDAPSPDAPGLREAVIHAARDVDGLWWPQDDNFTGTDLTFWGPEAGEALRDLRSAVMALDDFEHPGETPVRMIPEVE